MSKTAETIFQLKIMLRGSKPPIWRRVLVPSNILLPDLHFVIQKAMGWWDCHLHGFSVGNTMYVDHDLVDDWDDESPDERTIQLRGLIGTPKDSLDYDYDFGDGWAHRVTLEKILPHDASQRYPVCIAGARGCPPEDCGGMYGYVELLKIIADPKHPEYAEMMEWLPAGFNPVKFDLDQVNNRLWEPH